ncbi:A1S_2505 family phage non-structural protein [Acinetobacter sp. WZC-1]|uniref:A1S_2505 family phage non-structural protein n=1 Tax=Acinetobacter sp. WZC-1 TaxID=3459034 RepID=UPI00403DBD43
MTYHYHDETLIKNLPEDSVFVFGSNLAGTHAGGAAKTALLHFGAIKGAGRGWAGQSFAIPTMNEHLQQMPLSHIQHYIDDFKIYVKNHPKTRFFITAVGCGVAGYKVEEIAPMFRGIAHNVIFPASFHAFVEKTLPKLSQQLLQTIFQDTIIFHDDPTTAIRQLPLSEAEKSLAIIAVNTPMYPCDSNGRDRSYEISDILNTLNHKIFQFNHSSEDSMIFGGAILALLELYQINEKDFIDVWNGEREVSRPKAACKSRK